MRATRIMRNRQQRESRKRSLPLLFYGWYWLRYWHSSFFYRRGCDCRSQRHNRNVVISDI